MKTGGSKSKSIWGSLGLFLCLLGALALVTSFLAEGPYRAKSGLYQLVKESETASLFGDAGEAIGTPQVYVVNDRGAILEAKSEEGVAQLSLTKLEAKGEYPLQLRTVEAVMSYVRMGGIAVLLLGGLLVFGMSSRPVKKLAAAS